MKEKGKRVSFEIRAEKERERGREGGVREKKLWRSREAEGAEQVNRVK